VAVGPATLAVSLVMCSVRTWSAPSWRATATAWMDERLAAAGIARTGPVEQPHLRPWTTALRAGTTAGPVWLKAGGPGTAYEARIYEVLARAAPASVLVPIATDAGRGWTLLPDGGPALFGRGEAERPAALAGALAAFGRLQLEVAPHAGALLAAGVPDMRPSVMPRRLAEAIEAVGPDAAGPAVHRIAPAVAAWAERLAASVVPVSLDHNDLHLKNVLEPAAPGGPPRFYDWGDAVVAHPFAVALVPLALLRRLLGPDDPGVAAARDAYLDGFVDLGPRAVLAEELVLACRLAKVARVHTWERALRAAREAGEELPDAYRRAPRETLAAVPDADHLSGA